MPNDDMQIRSRSKPANGVHLWLVLWKANRTLEAIARRSVEGLGICLSDFGVLEALLHKGPLPVSALGEKVLLTSGSMTASVDRLQRRGLVKRRDDPGDRRVRIVYLTARGRRMISEMFSEHERAMDQAVSVLSARQRSTLAGLLRGLGRGAEGLLGGERKGVVGRALVVPESKRRMR
ncbi:MAG TPA: MarR family transcriptional regulator [Bryobacterales bacterium]|nr:MarR family transcriptional regulator [Bryobacterales bacterium]